eukprot:TRINITY_DN5180_c0_g1_i1.p1 TRINITY_DN5180_c0_g1~~TRINITY_DN5180_c0_g1_i1.p1  ORF type:complete len:489 (-),score=124.51 TRINITY_DN5180_c0_g1_i1:116-1582(-)
MSSTKVFTQQDIPENVQKCQYAVRGLIVLRAMAHEKTLKEKPGSLPFSRVTYCNIGNPQQLEQNPITFIRRVLALTECPELLEIEEVKKLFPVDVVDRAKEFLKEGGTGAYSNSQGREHVRKDIAAFINQRDGFKADDYSYANPQNIFLTDGASPAVQTTIRLLIRNSNDGIMIPIPQYPLYSATIPLLGGKCINYYLNEPQNWSLDVNELERSIQQAKTDGVNPRALVVINPGNPTGSCLTRNNIEDIIKFCHKHSILLMADEVYQENVYVKQEKPFFSFKKVLYELPKEYHTLELASFHSVSKGFVGECGKRGGYVELTNVDDAVKQEYYKLASVNLCPNVIGQLTMSLMVKPPKEGDASWELYKTERDQIYESLKRRAQLVVNKLNTCKGIKCNPAEGALYVFPQIELPPKAIEAAKSKSMAPDMLYSIELLDETGLCVVPGSGFGQRDGTYHFRTTILPKEEQLNEVLEQFVNFHNKFLEKYSQ